MKLSTGANEIPQGNESPDGVAVPDWNVNVGNARSEFRHRLMLLMFSSVVMAACGSAANKDVKTTDVLGQVELSRVAYATAQSEAQADGDAAKVASQKADLAKMARLRAARDYAGDLQKVAELRKSQAARLEKEMCEVDPDRCVNPEVVKSDSVDVKINALADGGISRLSGSSYPTGWEITFANGKFILFIGGQPKVAISADSVAVGKCFHVTAEGFLPVQCQ